jgi:hypothetical protein
VNLNLNESWRVETGRAILPDLVNDPPVWPVIEIK